MLRHTYQQHRFSIVVVITVFCIAITAHLLNNYYPLNLPDHNKLFARVVVDEHNIPLRTFADSKGVWRYPIRYSQVSPLYIQALLTYEDRWFWYHPGINPLSLLRAAQQNISQGKIVSGGSTISMQVARLLHPHPRTLLGKASQILRTLQLEWQLSKQQILALYLNIAPFGGTIAGVQAASYSYLNKPADKLTHGEAALLAVLPQAPSRYRPDLHPKKAQRARDKVLKRLADFSIWPTSIIEDAMLEQVFSFKLQAPKIAPLLSRRLLNQQKDQAIIKTTINAQLQQQLQTMLSHYVRQLASHSSGAILLIENKTLAVKAYVGTANFANSNNYGYLDMVQAIRSPGSTLKPFLYGLAFDEGLIHSQSLLADVPRSWSSYQPENFSGNFSGPVSAAQALQRSLNMPAVDLLERYGVNRFASNLQNAGLRLSLPNDEPNLAMILGGVGTSLEQLVQSYAALANEGKTSPLRYLHSELNRKQHQRPLLSKESAWLIYQILAKIKRPNALHSSQLNQQNQQLAWKTGTSYGFRDAWAIGVNKKYTIGVWLGRPDGTAVPGHYGHITAGPLLFSINDQLPITDNQLNQPKQVKQSTICWPLGTLSRRQADHFCQQKRQAWIINDLVPPTWHIADSDMWQANIFTYWQQPNKKHRVNISCSVANQQQKKVALWPKILEPWLSASNRRAQLVPPLASHCQSNTISASASLKIIGIKANSIYRPAGITGKAPSIWLTTLGGTGKKTWYINGKYHSTNNGKQAKEHLLTAKGKQQIIVQDQQGQTDMVTIFVQ